MNVVLAKPMKDSSFLMQKLQAFFFVSWVFNSLFGRHMSMFPDKKTPLAPDKKPNILAFLSYI